MAGEDWVVVLLGLVVGSFLLVMVLRYPELEGFASGRSTCPACRSPLAARDLVPIVSWIVLKGRCRQCTAPIGWQYPATEVAGAGLALWAATMFSGWLLWVSCALGWALLALALIDLRCYRLPDLLTLPMIIAGLVVTALAWPAELTGHLVGAALGYCAVTGIAWSYRTLRGREGIGLGDAKLLAAAGAWLSWQAVPQVVLIAAGLALAAAVITSLGRRVPLSAATRIPFGPYLAIAIWLIWLYGPLDLAP